MAKIALVTVLDDPFMPGFRVFWKSFIKHNEWFDHDFIIFNCGLSETSKQEIRDTYGKAIIKDIDYNAYKRITKGRKNGWIKPTHYTIETFKQYDYNRLVYIDMDVLILGRIKELFKCKAEFAAVKGYKTNTDKLFPWINSGVFVLNNVSKNAYSDLLTILIRGVNATDQGAINEYYEGKITYLDKIYNVEKRMLHSKRFREVFKNKMILHFVASKPWEKEKPTAREQRYRVLEDLWNSYL